MQQRSLSFQTHTHKANEALKALKVEDKLESLEVKPNSAIDNKVEEVQNHPVTELKTIVQIGKKFRESFYKKFLTGARPAKNPEQKHLIKSENSQHLEDLK